MQEKKKIKQTNSMNKSREKHISINCEYRNMLVNKMCVYVCVNVCMCLNVCVYVCMCVYVCVWMNAQNYLLWVIYDGQIVFVWKSIFLAVSEKKIHGQRHSEVELRSWVFPSFPRPVCLLEIWSSSPMVSSLRKTLNASCAHFLCTISGYRCSVILSSHKTNDNIAALGYLKL
jgi:hypothetical protein